MPRCLVLFIATSMLFWCCGNDEPDIIIIEAPRLPKIDCKQYLRHVGADLARRGLGNSSIATRVIKREREWCNEENERRGY